MGKMKKIVKVFLLLTMLGAILTACSSPKKPEDVRQEFWDYAIQHTIYINSISKDGKGDSFYDEWLDMDESELSEGEREIWERVAILKMDSFSLRLSGATGRDTTETKARYDENYLELKDIFGGKNLKEENLDLEKLAMMSEDNEKNKGISEEETDSLSIDSHLTSNQNNLTVLNHRVVEKVGLYYVTGEIKNHGTTSVDDEIIDIVFLDENDNVIKVKPIRVTASAGGSMYFDEVVGQPKNTEKPVKILLQK